MSRWQLRMLKVDALMARAAACERSLTVHVYLDKRKLAEAIRFSARK